MDIDKIDELKKLDRYLDKLEKIIWFIENSRKANVDKNGDSILGFGFSNSRIGLIRHIENYPEFMNRCIELIYYLAVTMKEEVLEKIEKV